MMWTVVHFIIGMLIGMTIGFVEIKLCDYVCGLQERKRNKK